MGWRTGMRPGEGTYVERFWARVDRNGPVPSHRPELGQCWLWTKSKCSLGYGTVRCNNRVDGAHRVALWIATGAQPGKWVLHKCDNPTCCNPDHLFEGTREDNMRDMVAKGRQRGAAPENHNSRRYPERRPRGEKQWCAKLNSDIVREIRASDETSYRLAKRLGMGISAICRVRQRRTWKHVT